MTHSVFTQWYSNIIHFPPSLFWMNIYIALLIVVLFSQAFMGKISFFFLKTTIHNVCCSMLQGKIDLLHTTKYFHFRVRSTCQCTSFKHVMLLLATFQIFHSLRSSLIMTLIYFFFGNKRREKFKITDFK